MLDLLHEDWLPEENKDVLKSLIIELIENMYEDQKRGYHGFK